MTGEPLKLTHTQVELIEPIGDLLHAASTHEDFQKAMRYMEQMNSLLEQVRYRKFGNASIMKAPNNGGTQ